MSVSPSQPPDWFARAIAVPCEHHSVMSNGCPIHYQTWPCTADLPGLLLIHGHAANAHWWDFIAPGLTDRFRVLAMDVSGAGDSGHRDSYSDQLFADEVMHVRQHAGLDARSLLVGHSFGGRIARHVQHLHREAFTGLVLVDSALGPSRGNKGLRQLRPKPVRHYPSMEEAVRRFRLRPPQACANGFLLDHIARHSVRQDAGRWYWKLDPGVFDRMPDLAADTDPVGMLDSLNCRRALIFGRQSRFYPPEFVQRLGTVLPGVELIGIDDAHHHLFLDQPLAFIAALRQLLAGWH